MIQCSVCGALIRHVWNGVYDKETGTVVCNSCYDSELHADLDDADWLLDGDDEDAVQ